MTPEDFWLRVAIPDDLPDAELIAVCWPWTGGRNKDGYAIARVNGKVVYGHHFAYAFLFGPPPPGHEIRHMCHNRLCCNPYHYQSGTHIENLADSGLVKLSDDQVAAARHRRAAGEKLSAIARSLGVSPNYISELVSGKYRTSIQHPASSIEAQP
jgi:hypothetical protein